MAKADSAMGDAGGRLGEGNADGAVDSQGKALEGCARAPRALPRSMQQGDGDGQGDGPGNRAGPAAERRQPERSARPAAARTRIRRRSAVKIPGEIDVQRVRRILEELRRRLADPQRPQIELDYIERLLKDY